VLAPVHAPLRHLNPEVIIRPLRILALKPAVRMNPRSKPMKLELRVRYNRGRVASPTTTAGYVGQIALVLAFALALALDLTLNDRGSDWRRLPPGAILGTLLFIFTRDALAWFQATDIEREAFRREVMAARELGTRWAPPLSPSNQSLVLLASATVMFGFMGVILWMHVRPLVVIPALGWLYVIIRTVPPRAPPSE
jgi:hypothetical protein